MATKISFWKKSKSQYDALENVAAGGVYFVEDGTSGKIYLNGKCYGEVNEVANAVSGVSFVSEGDHANSLKIDFTTGTSQYVKLPEGAIYTAGKGISIENKVISALDETLNEDLTVTGVSVGNLTDGSTLTAGTSLQDLLKKMLTKELDYSKGSNPSVTLTGIANSGTILRIAGTEVTGTLGYRYSDGTFKSYTNASTAAGCTSGEPTYNPAALPVELDLGDNKFTVSIPYNASTAQATLKTNIGNPSKIAQIPAGTATGSVTIKGTLPIYATTASSEMTQQSLIEWKTAPGSMESNAMTLVATTPTAPRKFSVPRKATSLTQLNTLSGKYEQVALSAYTETTETKTFGSISQEYHIYTFAGAAEGAVTIKVKF